MWNLWVRQQGLTIFTILLKKSDSKNKEKRVSARSQCQESVPESVPGFVILLMHVSKHRTDAERENIRATGSGFDSLIFDSSSLSRWHKQIVKACPLAQILPVAVRIATVVVRLN